MKQGHQSLSVTYGIQRIEGQNEVERLRKELSYPI
jgi:hypothetical protein